MNELEEKAYIFGTIPTVISALFFTLIQEATGEETGWRGFFLWYKRNYYFLYQKIVQEDNRIGIGG